MASPNRPTASAAASTVSRFSLPQAACRSAVRLAPGSVQSGLPTNAAVGAVSVFSKTRVRPGLSRAMASALVATTRSPASSRSASPIATRVFIR
ncbi:hypothetical protein D3C81_2031990 [compost metagenome]